MLLSSALALGISGALPGAARAQSLGESGEARTSDVPATYQSAMKLGFAEYEQRKYQEARARFSEANQIMTNARSLRALGAVAYDLQNYVESIDYLRSALASDVRRLEGALRTQTENLLERARGYVARYTFVLEPKQTELVLDGELVSLRPDDTLWIAVGDHKLHAGAPGFVDSHQTLHVTGRQDATLRIVLEPRPQPAEPTKPLARAEVKVPL
ncbi:MAG TPA: tetratricopeptide repeat protein, partial [Polyangiales bacterium]